MEHWYCIHCNIVPDYVYTLAEERWSNRYEYGNYDMGLDSPNTDTGYLDYVTTLDHGRPRCPNCEELVISVVDKEEPKKIKNIADFIEEI